MNRPPTSAVARNVSPGRPARTTSAAATGRIDPPTSADETVPDNRPPLSSRTHWINVGGWAAAEDQPNNPARMGVIRKAMKDRTRGIDVTWGQIGGTTDRGDRGASKDRESRPAVKVGNLQGLIIVNGVTKFNGRGAPPADKCREIW